MNNTPDQRAIRFYNTFPQCCDDLTKKMCEMVTQMIVSAVQEEREASANVAGVFSEEAAKEIRARSKS